MFYVQITNFIIQCTIIYRDSLILFYISLMSIHHNAITSVFKTIVFRSTQVRPFKICTLGCCFFFLPDRKSLSVVNSSSMRVSPARDLVRSSTYLFLILNDVGYFPIFIDHLVLPIPWCKKIEDNWYKWKQSIIRRNVRISISVLFSTLWNSVDMICWSLFR